MHTCILSRYCPSRHRRRNSQMGHRRMSSPNWNEEVWRALCLSCMNPIQLICHPVRQSKKRRRISKQPEHLQATNNNGANVVPYFTWDAETKFLESVPQCMAYILAKWPRNVRLVRIWIRPIASMLAVAWTSVVSQADFLASYSRSKWTTIYQSYETTCRSETSATYPNGILQSFGFLS